MDPKTKSCNQNVKRLMLHESYTNDHQSVLRSVSTTSTTTPVKTMNQPPFAIQELVDLCIHFLRDSQRDLRACALVSRSWVYPAQSHVFREITIAGGDPGGTPLTEWGGHRGGAKPALWLQLQQTLETSPHLIPHIRRLSIDIRVRANEQLLLSICNFPFTHLEHAGSRFDGDFTLQTAFAFQELFSLPTIRSIKLKGAASLKPTTFTKIFERCSPSVRKLDVQVNGALPFPAAPENHAGAPIKLASLMIAIVGPIDRPLTVHPFTTSNLKALALTSLFGIAWNDVISGTKTIEFLSMIVQTGPPANMAVSAIPSVKTFHTNLDLSMLPRLSVLHIKTGTFGLDATVEGQMVNTLISTIPPEHQMHTIVITLSTAIPSAWEALDLTLSRMRVSSVEIQVYLRREEAPLCFPRLSAKNIVRAPGVLLISAYQVFAVQLHVVHFNPSWWEDITGGL
ncbi:hypothetical protein B0H19DRAFT_1378823 [Mycena capillaripes]|nr:hypothetical protein B0H19DRAFT_1378823 [Mycena capillaripes]